MGAAISLLDKYNNGQSLAFDGNGNLDASSMLTGSYIVIGGVRFYTFTSAITENVTTTSAPAGSYAFTSNATGKTKIFRSDGSKWQAVEAPINVALYAEATIASADITGTSAGQLGHANGYPIVAAPGVGFALEFLSGVVILDFATAAYTGGGNVTFNYGGGGAALSGAVSAANSLGAAADKIAVVLAATPTNNQLSANTGINLVAASAFTQPGTAAGVARVQCRYRIVTTGL